jgi:hypothetical protein
MKTAAKENKASKVMHEENIRSDESIPDTDDDEQQDFDEIKDPRQQVYIICMLLYFNLFCSFDD